MRYPRYAVIPSNGRDILKDSVMAIAEQVDTVLVVMNGDPADFASAGAWSPENVNWVKAHSNEVNISRWWNQGIDYFDRLINRPIAGGQIVRYHKWDVAIINDDVIVPEGWFDAVSGAIRQMGVSAGCSGGYGMPVLHTQAGPVDLSTTMQGFAFILAGERGLRADERYRWYCGDNDLAWRAAADGGMVMIPGYHVQHLYPNGQVSPAMQILIAEDMQAFVDKWSVRPW